MRLGLVPAVLPPHLPEALLLEILFNSLTLLLFRDHRGLQASQAQLGFPQW